MGFEKYLLSESKATMTPYLKSMFNSIDTLTKDEAMEIMKGLDSVGFDKTVNVQVSIGNKKQPQIAITTSNRKYEDEDALKDKVSQALKPLGYKIGKSSIKSQTLHIDFK